jgi:ATP-dependent RNA helicase DDX52/ROK1
MSGCSPYALLVTSASEQSQVFQKSDGKDARGKNPTVAAAGELPPELDFFKYAQGSVPKRRAAETSASVPGEEGDANDDWERPNAKRLKINDEDGDTTLKQGKDGSFPHLMQRHRVATRGSNVPTHADSFEELRKRYSVSPLLLGNLSKYEYTHPTAIQSYCMPILLEVRTPLAKEIRLANELAFSLETSQPFPPLVLARLFRIFYL